MSDAHFASLSSTLLARKGGAKPAMRPQSAALGPVDGVAAAANLEDLGWNDMGEDAPPSPPVAEDQAPRRIMPDAPSLMESGLIESGDFDADDGVEIEERRNSSDGADIVSIAPRTGDTERAANLVRESIDKLADQLESPVPAENDDEAQTKPTEVRFDATTLAAPKSPKSKKTRSAARSSAASKGKRAAFTLRLDPQRHLMLRLACTVRGSSAQQLVTDALDGLLAEMPEIASLAAQVQRSSH